MSERTSSEIQRDIERTRAEMGHTIDSIQERLSPGQLVDQFLRSGGGRSVASGANDFAVNLGRAIRENPIPVLLIGTGIAWLMLSRGRRPYGRDVYEPYEAYDEELWTAHYGSTEEAAERYDERMRRREEVGRTDTDPAFAGHYGAAPGPYGSGTERTTDPTAQRPGVSGSTVGAAAVNPGGTTGSDGPQSASERARQAAAEARERAAHASPGPEYTTHAAGPAGATGTGHESSEETGGDWRSKGRETFERASESSRYGMHEARRGMGRASAGAREQARRAQHQARRGARRAGGAFSRLFQEQPLLVGAIGIAVGAAIGALVPVTRREDEWLGETSDELKHRAQEEVARARRVAARTAEAAREEAVRQGLTPEGAKEELRATQRAAEQTMREAQHVAGQKVREAQHEMEESAKRTAEQKMHESQDLAREKMHEAEQAARAKADEAGDRFRKVGEAAKEAAKDEAKRGQSGEAEKRGPSV